MNNNIEYGINELHKAKELRNKKQEKIKKSKFNELVFLIIVVMCFELFIYIGALMTR